MYTRLMLPIGLATLIMLVLCAALGRQAASATDYTLATADGLALTLSHATAIPVRGRRQRQRRR